MKLIRCNNGHFYDQDKFGACPNCGGGDSAADQLTDAFQNTPQSSMQNQISASPQIFPEEDATQRRVEPEAILSNSLEQVFGQMDATMPLSQAKAMNDISNMSDVNAVFSPEDGDEGYTVSMTPGGKEIGAAGLKPVVGWLICLSGEHIGKDFRLVQGKNFIGRDPAMDVCLEHEKTVSRDKHALIVYEPKHHLYLIQSGESKELTYVNDKVILESKALKAMDEILVGEVRLLFVPLCSEEFNWANVLEGTDESDKE